MQSESNTVEDYLKSLPQWQKANLSLFRSVVHKIIPDVIEVIKWGVPVFTLNKKLLFAMAAFKEHTKFNFIQNGALIDDANKFFNNGLESRKSRAIDLRQGEGLDKAMLETLVKRSVEQLNK